MHLVFILACFAVSLTFASSKFSDILITSKITGIHNVTLEADTNVIPETSNKLNSSKPLKSVSSFNSTNNIVPASTIFPVKKETSTWRNQHDFKQVKQVSSIHPEKFGTTGRTDFTTPKYNQNTEHVDHSYFLQKVHARITRSKDAIWATITLTALCILLVLAVAQSRMWKEHYYSESQGVPLPNFNERVLFKDVMERKISSLKQFFKKPKHSKEKNITELESLLPASEWD